MIIYNTTYNVSQPLRNKWLAWAKGNLIPKLMESGYFTEYQLARVLIEEETGGFTYSLQFKVKDASTYNQYSKKMLPQIQQEQLVLFGPEVVFFTTLLEVLD